jgi:hypothetical protein
MKSCNGCLISPTYKAKELVSWAFFFLWMPDESCYGCLIKADLKAKELVFMEFAFQCFAS